MAGVTLQRTNAYRAKGVPQIGSVLWKTGKIFTMQYMAKQGQFTPPNAPFFSYSEYFFPVPFTFSEPVSDGKTLFFTCYIGDGYLFAIDADTGRALWTYKSEGRSVSEPAVAGDILYFGSGNGVFHALNARTGQERWTFKEKEKERHYTAPLVADGLVYTGSSDGNLYALEAQTGEAKWVIRGKGSIGQAALADGTIYFSGSKNLLYAIDLKTGQEKWTFKTKGYAGAPVVGNGAVYFRTYDGDLYALDARTGAQKWQSRTGNKPRRLFFPSSVNFVTTLAFGDGLIYFGDTDKLYAVDAGTGQAKWQFETKRPGRSPVLANGIVYFGSVGKLYAVDALTGQQKWGLETVRQVEDREITNIPSSPVVADGRLFFVNDDGHVYALQ
jgi:eukaryotic-like serine/threonine-protein kinase